MIRFTNLKKVFDDTEIEMLAMVGENRPSQALLKGVAYLLEEHRKAHEDPNQIDEDPEKLGPKQIYSLSSIATLNELLSLETKAKKFIRS